MSRDHSTSSSPLGAFGTILIALGVAAAGALVLDFHAHACATCGNRWRHLGMLSGGNRVAHTCSKCGTEQWWRPGERERALGPTATVNQAAIRPIGDA